MGEIHLNWIPTDIMKLIKAVNSSDFLEADLLPNLSDKGSFIIRVFDKTNTINI